MVLSIASLDLTAVVFGIVPMSAGVGFLLWVGVLITAQAFEQDPSSANHSWAVALGLIPCLAAWALQLVEATVQAALGGVPLEFSNSKPPCEPYGARVRLEKAPKHLKHSGRVARLVTAEE